MSKKINILWQIVILVIAACVIITVVGCQIDPGAETPTGEEETPEEEEPTVIPPPENLIGTIALTNGKSAVMDLQFASASSNYMPEATPRATVGVTGKVRYEGEDYTVGGLYNDETGALDIFAENASGQRFVFSGTYTPGSGFSGTVKLYDSDQTTVIAEGSVSSTEATDEERSTIKIYTGTFGGDAYGTWNGTLTTDRFYGTWSGNTPGGWASGTFSMTRSNNSLSNLTGSNGPVGGGGTLFGTTSSGWWAGQDSTSGSWTGAEVDSNYDHHVPNAGDDSAYLANIILQAFENGVSLYNNTVDDGTISEGDTYQNISATLTDYDGDSIDDYTYNFGIGGSFDPPYTDTQTGLKIAGQLLIEEQNADVWHLLIDSDVSDYTLAVNPPVSDNGGLTITFPDTTSIDLFVDVEIDDAAETIGPNNFGDATWELDGNDVLPDVISVFF